MFLYFLSWPVCLLSSSRQQKALRNLCSKRGRKPGLTRNIGKLKFGVVSESFLFPITGRLGSLLLLLYMHRHPLCLVITSFLCSFVRYLFVVRGAEWWSSQESIYQGDVFAARIVCTTRSSMPCFEHGVVHAIMLHYFIISSFNSDVRRDANSHTFLNIYMYVYICIYFLLCTLEGFTRT